MYDELSQTYLWNHHLYLLSIQVINIYLYTRVFYIDYFILLLIFVFNLINFKPIIISVSPWMPDIHWIMCGLCIWPWNKIINQSTLAFQRRGGRKGGSDSFVWWSHSLSVECIKNLSRLKTDPRRIISASSTTDIHFEIINAFLSNNLHHWERRSAVISKEVLRVLWHYYQTAV